MTAAERGTRGIDLTSAQLAAPALEPLDPSIATDALVELGGRIAERTWEHGLPNWFWGEGVALIGLVQFAQAAGRPDDRIAAWFDRWHAAEPPVVEHVNHLAPGTAGVRSSPAQRDLVAPLADWADRSPLATRDRNGALEHWPGAVWADTMYMAGVCLAALGELDREQPRIDELGRQIVAHAEILQSPEHGLFAHGSIQGITLPNWWGRANAWAALAAVEYLEIVGRTGLGDPALVEAVTNVLRRQLTTLAELQPAHGVWSVLVDEQPECAGIVETSAAAGIGAAMLRAAALAAVDPAIGVAGELAVRGALAYVDGDGTLTRVSAGTVLQLVPFGYSVIRDDRLQLWGQGLALSAVAALLEHRMRTP